MCVCVINMYCAALSFVVSFKLSLKTAVTPFCKGKVYGGSRPNDKRKADMLWLEMMI